jgi:hypothetical protein
MQKQMTEITKRPQNIIRNQNFPCPKRNRSTQEKPRAKEKKKTLNMPL